MPANAHAHHVFPKATEFDSFFTSKGLNVNDPKFGTWWEGTSHIRNKDVYNAEWRLWIGNNPDAQLDDILNFGRQLMEQYGLPVHY